MHLNLGCGNKKIPGWVNVDKMPVCNPDQVVGPREASLALGRRLGSGDEVLARAGTPGRRRNNLPQHYQRALSRLS